MPTTEGRLMPSISDDVRAIEEALDAGPKWYGAGWRAWTDINGTWQVGPSTNDAAVSVWRDEKSEATADYIAAAHPARLRRVLDAMQAMGEALREMEAMAERYRPAGYPTPEAQKKARAALALYEGKQ